MIVGNSIKPLSLKVSCLPMKKNIFAAIKWLQTICFINWSILVVWLECRFLDTEVDGSNRGISMLCP